MSCVLRVFGEKFEIDKFISESGWELLVDNEQYVIRKGDNLSSVRKSVAEHSGFQIEVSKTDFKNFDKQQEDCIQFIRTHKAVFELLLNYHIDWKCFDFGLETRFQNGFSKTHILQSELMKQCGEFNIDVWMSNYLTRNDKRKKRRMARKVWRKDLVA